MSGLGNHLSHLYEKDDITFATIEDIFRNAANGRLQGTRKTDGINLFISYSVKRSVSLAARNKTRDLKNGGSTAFELAKAYEDKEIESTDSEKQTFGPVKEVFMTAIKMFELLVQNLSIDEQKHFFGEDADIWYNIEILNQKTKNVIQYDTDLIIFHRTGSGILDRKKGEVVQPEELLNSNEGSVLLNGIGIRSRADIQERLTQLQNKITKIQTRYPYKLFPVQVDAIETLQSLSDQTLVNNYLNQLKNLYSSVGLNANSTLADYILARTKPIISQKEQEFKVQIPNDIKILLVKRLFGVSINLSSIKKNLSKEQKEFISFFENKEFKKELFKNAIQPLELLITDFSSELLKSLRSLFVLEPSKQNEKIRKQLESAIEFINGSNISDKVLELRRQLEKIKKLDDVSIAEEGFVFDWNGQTFKFTGKFAPINQILNLEKTLRFELEKVRTLSLTDSELGKEKALKQTSGLKVGIIVGSFKPPHKGHLKLIDETARLVDKLFVFITDPKTADAKRTVGLFPFPAVLSEEMLKSYIKDNENKDKIKLIIDQSPMDKLIDYISGNNVATLPSLKDVSKIIVGFSEEDQLKYSPLVRYVKYDREKNPDDYKKYNISKRTYFNIVKPELDKLNKNNERIPIKVSATKFRNELLKVIKNNDLEAINQFFPENLSSREKFRFVNLIRFEYEKYQNSLRTEKLDDIIKEAVKDNYYVPMIFKG